MSHRLTYFVAAVGWFTLLTAPASAQTQDRVRRVDGPSVRGQVVSMSPTVVTVKQNSGGETQVAVNEIDTISFSGEPSELTQARAKVGAQRFEDALESLAELDAASITRKEIRQDAEFYRALCNAQLALSGTKQVSDAGRELYAFIKSSADSYHVLEANELLGNLLMAAGTEKNAGQAQLYYDKVLGAVDWNETKLRVGVLSGRSLIAQKKYAEASKRFDSLLSITAETEDGLRQRQFARLGQGLSVALGGDAKSGIQTINAVLEQVIEEDASDAELLAHGYRARALASLSAGDRKQSLFDFLHVHLLYNGFPQTHAEALYQLALLWKEQGQEDRAKEAAQLLKQRYPESHWANQSGD